MKRNRNSALALALLLLVALAACSKKEQPAPPNEPKKAQPAPPAQAAPVQKQVSSAGAGPGRLDFSKRTDPFKAFVAPAPAAPAPSAEAPQRGDLLPIQSFDTAKFRVVGIIAGLNENRALILDPNGKGYVVQEGMQIGSSDGRITRITPSSVEVVERYKEDNGRVRKRKIILPLAKKR